MKDKVSLPDGFHDLGEKPMEMKIEKMSSGSSEVYYPSLFFRGKDKLKDLPKSGTAIIHFKKVMERVETVDRDGKKDSSYCVELEIHGIKPDGSSKEISTDEKETSDEDAIEMGLAAAGGESEDSETETETEETEY